MKNLKIFTKLFLSHSVIGLLAIVMLSSVVYFTASNILIQRALDQLSSINILKKDLVENYFVSSHQNLQELQLEHKFLNLYRVLKNDQARVEAQRIHDVLEMDSINTLYDFKNFYLFDDKNRLLHSSGKTGLPAKLLLRIDSVVRHRGDHLQLIDASGLVERKQPLIYYYIPLLHGAERMGMVLVEDNLRKIQKILLENTGLGNTGESYLVDEDLTMRSASRFLIGQSPASIVVNTEAARNASAGMSGQGIFDDYRHEKVLSVYRPVSTPGLKWSIISEVDWREAMEPVVSLRNYLLVVTIIIMVVVLLVTFFLSNAIARPVLQLKEIIIALSKGTIPSQEPKINSQDEIGLMASAVWQLMEGLQRTTVFANEIGAGNFSTSFTRLSEGDKLGHALLHMRDELQRFHEREIKSARERAAALIEGQENERRRIINELHDGVGQLLTAIRMRVDMLEHESMLKAEIKEQINETIAEVKRISYNVMPQALVDFGLEAALKGLCDNIKKYATLIIDFRYVRECSHILSFEMTIALFRIAQEGLNNIIKHANASHVNLHVLDKEDEVYMVLEDNGKGFNEPKLKNRLGSGLRNIRERAKLLNGHADITSAPGSGTVIEVHIPVPEIIVHKDDD